MSSWCKQSFFFCILWILSWNVFCCYFLIQLCFCKPYFYETHMPILCFKMCFLLGIKAAKKMVENILEIDVTKPIFFYCPFQNDVIQWEYKIHKCFVGEEFVKHKKGFGYGSKWNISVYWNMSIRMIYIQIRISTQQRIYFMLTVN